MTTKILSLGRRPRTIPALAALLGVTVLIAAPSTAHAASRSVTTPLAQGVGMGAKPSIRVRTVQRALHKRGYDLGAPGVDGRFGPLTATAVRRFQADMGLAVDGIVGTHTRKALRLDKSVARATSRHRHAPQRAEANRSSERTATPRPAAPTRPTPASTTAVRSTGHDLDDPSSTSRVLWVLMAAAGAAVAFLITRAFVAILQRSRARRMPAKHLAAFRRDPLDRTLRGTGGPPRSSTSLVSAVPTNLYVDARTGNGSAGPVRGFAIAVAFAQKGDGPERLFLVDDPSRSGPVWVHESDVRLEHRGSVQPYGKPATRGRPRAAARDPETQETAT